MSINSGPNYMTNVSRVNDKDYIIADNPNLKVSVHVEGSKIDAETRFNLVEKAQQELRNIPDIKHVKKQIRFQFGDKNWKVVVVRENWFRRLLAQIFPLLLKPTDDRIVRFEIKSTGKSVPKSKRPWVTKAMIKQNKEWKKETKNSFALSNFKNLRISPNAKVADVKFPAQGVDYKQGVRAAADLKELYSPVGENYVDPFTRLSTVAFQRFESHYIAHDNTAPETCDYRLVEEHNQLKLVHKNSPLAQDPDRCEKAVNIFRNYIKHEYGEERVEQINHLYKLRLDNITELTPEHVYRFNIGTTNVEISHVHDTARNLATLYDQTARLSPRTDFENIKNDVVPLSAMKRLHEVLSKEKGGEKVTLQDFRNWMERRGRLEGDPANLPSRTIEDLINILVPSPIDLEKSYTGRKIFGMIKSSYSTAEIKEYKPWVDQQELMQIREELINARTPGAYHEILAHVVVKKHLARDDANNGYRVGALIPARAEPGQEPRWYSVSSCITNGYTYSYTLNGVASDTQLPAIKLFRSTASSPYALYSQGTVMSDVNQLNAPGHLGQKMIDSYEKKFFEDRSIPSWVGYQVGGAKILEEDRDNLEGAFNLLKKSNASLLETRTKREKKSMVDILEEHDAILGSIYLSAEKVIPLITSTKEMAAFGRSFKKYIKKYLNSPAYQVKGIKSEEQYADAQKLKKMLNSIAPQVVEKHQKEQLNALFSDLDKHILDVKVDKEAIEQNAQFLTNNYKPFKEMEREVATLLQSNNRRRAREVMENWSQGLNQVAVSLHEDAASKKKEDVCITGHSLGGANAQVALVHYFAKADRVPLPDQICQAYLFDDPQVSRKDNEIFKEFGNRHSDLLNTLNMQFKIFRRQEASDIVPMGGEEHIGSTYSDKEAEDVGRWLSFDAAVNQRLDTSRRMNISDSTIAHETRYLAGEHQRTFNKPPKEIAQLLRRQKLGDKDAETLLKKLQVYEPAAYEPHAFPRNREGAMDSGPRDMIVTSYDTRVQGVFDRRGKIQSLTKKQGEKAYKVIREDLWKIPNFFEKILRENKRKSTNSLFMFLRRLLFKSAASTHEVKENYLDRFGVLAVDQTGVVSKDR